MSKILLARKLAVAHILDTIRQAQGLEQGSAKAPGQGRVRAGGRKTIFTDNLWAQAALAFRKGELIATVGV